MKLGDLHESFWAKNPFEPAVYIESPILWTRAILKNITFRQIWITGMEYQEHVMAIQKKKSMETGSYEQRMLDNVTYKTLMHDFNSSSRVNDNEDRKNYPEVSGDAQARSIDSLDVLHEAEILETTY